MEVNKETMNGLASNEDSNRESSEQLQLLFRRIAIYFGIFEPTGSFSLSYMAEGAANVVWTIHFHSSNLQWHDSTVVFRMRKNIKSTVSMLELKQQFEQRIATLFIDDPSLLLAVDLVRLCPDIIQGLNKQLLQLEASGKRPPMRAGIFHPDFGVEPYAMIMPNLYHGTGKVIEFKPKWLVQSPSAPRNAQTCRTCALNAMRRMKGGSGRGDSGFCPFDLLSRNHEILGNALKNIWKEELLLGRFVEVFQSKVQPALRQLQKMQRIENEVGLRDFQQPENRDFAVAMALRDCSMVLKVERRDDVRRLDIPTIKLLDLDLKDTGGGKLAKWARMESELIDEGWYTIQGDPTVRCAMAFQ